jgi:hypothetical protein
MSKRQVIMILGVWVMIFMFLGFPVSWVKIIALISGALVVILAYRMPPGTRTDPGKNLPYVEHRSRQSAESSITSDSSSTRA